MVVVVVVVGWGGVGWGGGGGGGVGGGGGCEGAGVEGSGTADEQGRAGALHGRLAHQLHQVNKMPRSMLHGMCRPVALRRRPALQHAEGRAAPCDQSAS